MNKKITRRKFVQTSTAAAATVAIAPSMSCSRISSPYDAKGLATKKLGNTGVRVPFMGFGMGSRWMAVEEDDKALEILEYALNQGLYYWDTASSYGNDRISSEERVGKILPKHRDEVFLVTKTQERTAEGAKADIEQSLKRLNTDHIDLLHVHALKSVEDAEMLGEKGMVLEVLHQYKSEGIIKHIGFTGHSSAEGMKRAAELYDFEAMMIALNHQFKDGSQKFEELPAPYANKKGLGVIAMKVVRPRETVETLAIPDLIRYALSLKEFHMINVGIDSMDVLKENLEIFKSFKPFDDKKMDEIKVALRPFHQGKDVAWMHPSYVDGCPGASNWA